MKCTDQVIQKLIFLNNKEEKKKHGRVKDFDIMRNMTIMGIEYLSIKNNNLKHLRFIKYLSRLWYLDARDNSIENFDGLQGHECFGFLSLTLGKYSYSKFFQLESLKIGILQIDGYFEEKEKFKKFIFSNKNKIFKINEEIVLYKDFEDYHGIDKIIEEQAEDEEKSMSNMSSSITESESDSENGWNVFAKNSKFGLLLGFIKEFDKSLAEIKLKNILKFLLVMKNMHGKLLGSLPEYLVLEKKKLLIVYKIFKSFTEYESPDIPIKVNYDILKVHEITIQTVIIEILLLVILNIFNHELAYRTLKLILKSEYKNNNQMNENLSYHLKMIIQIDILYLIGLYFDLLLHLQEMKDEKNMRNVAVEKDNNLIGTFISLNCVSFEKRKSVLDEKVKNNLSKNIKINSPTINNEHINDLHIEGVFTNINLIVKRHKKYSSIFMKSEGSTMAFRKIFINSNIINFIEEYLNCNSDVLNITQHVYDFLIYKRYDLEIILKSYYEYKIFLEIRNYIIEKFNKIFILNQNLFIHSNKDYHKFLINKLNNDYYLNENKCKGKNLFYKENPKIEPEKSVKNGKNKNNFLSYELNEIESSRRNSLSNETTPNFVSPTSKFINNFGKLNYINKTRNSQCKESNMPILYYYKPSIYLPNLFSYDSTQESNASNFVTRNSYNEKSNIIDYINNLKIVYKKFEKNNTLITESPSYISSEKLESNLEKSNSDLNDNNHINVRENFFDEDLYKKNKLKNNKKIAITNNVNINDAILPKLDVTPSSNFKEIFKIKTTNKYLVSRKDRNNGGSIIYYKNRYKQSLEKRYSLLITPLPLLSENFRSNKDSFTNIKELKQG